LHTSSSTRGSTDSRTLAYELFETLTAAITASALPPGERLTETRLANEYGVSRTPVREALRLLDQAGLVEKSSSRGYVVRVIDLAAIDEIYTVRSALEELAVELVARRRSAPDFKAFRETTVNDSTDPDVHKRFHEILVQLAGNQELQQTLSLIYARTRPYRRLDTDRTEIQSDHALILEHIANNEVEEARKLMREHVARTQRVVRNLILAGIRHVSFSPEQDHLSGQSND
jgi:DNA-binding GntR family transcriptional regulator